MQQEASSVSSLVMFSIPGADMAFTISQLQWQLIVFSKQEHHDRMFVNIVLHGEAFKMLRETIEHSPSLDSAHKWCCTDITRYAETLYQELDAVHKDAIADVSSKDSKPPVDMSGDTECYDMDDDDVANAPMPPELQVTSVCSNPAITVYSLGQTASKNFVQMTVGEPNPNDISDSFEMTSSPVRNDSGSRTWLMGWLEEHVLRTQWQSLLLKLWPKTVTNDKLNPSLLLPFNEVYWKCLVMLPLLSQSHSTR